MDASQIGSFLSHMASEFGTIAEEVAGATRASPQQVNLIQTVASGVAQGAQDIPNAVTPAEGRSIMDRIVSGGEAAIQIALPHVVSPEASAAVRAAGIMLPAVNALSRILWPHADTTQELAKAGVPTPPPTA